MVDACVDQTKGHPSSIEKEGSLCVFAGFLLFVCLNICFWRAPSTRKWGGGRYKRGNWGRNG